jgi:pimeloyl-ACP methyl ester carboxylesterase
MAIEKGRLEVNGLSFAVLAAGPKGGPVALLLHGFPEGKESWLPQLQALADAGYRAVAPDLRGYGGTDAPTGVEAYTLARINADVEGLVDALGEDAVDLVGHDWGAIIGWSFTSRFPTRVRTWTALSVGHPDLFLQADEDQLRRSSYIELFNQPGGKAEQVLLEDGARRLRGFYRVGPNPDAVPDDHVEAFVRGFERPGRLTAGLNYYRANLRGQALGAYPPCPNPISTPTQLIWGDHDPALGRRQAELTGPILRGPYRFEVVEGAGHWLQFEAPDRVSRLLVEHLAGARA